MRILVFSDSHMFSSNMQKVLALQKGRFDLCVHLGDGIRDFLLLAQSYPEVSFLSVKGNCDNGPPGLLENIITLEDKRIFFTHGHRYNVKYDVSELVKTAREKECDIALFGHTHKSMSVYLNEDDNRPIYLFNPGSISFPREERPSYGVIDIRRNGILLNIVKI